MPKIDIDTVEPRVGSSYPAPYDEPCRKRSAKRLGEAGGLTQFGANLATLPPGAWSSQRHVHSAEDEFTFIVSGRCVMIDNDGETELQAGDACAHPAGDGNAHHLINRYDEPCVYLAVGSRDIEQDDVDYPDIDMKIDATGGHPRKFMRKDGTLYL